LPGEPPLSHPSRHPFPRRPAPRSVALKALRPEVARELGTDRFLREIRISARLNHPGILTLIDSGDVDGVPWYVMPLVAGGSLRDRLESEVQLPVEEALTIAREVGDALGSAHALGIVHRDVKPENILFEAGHAVVADFGVARAVREAGGGRLSETGLAVGTATYMSPEQASGSAELDSRADVYVVLAQLSVWAVTPISSNRKK
jgi:serine/threonine protein kinase